MEEKIMIKGDRIEFGYGTTVSDFEVITVAGELTKADLVINQIEPSAGEPGIIVNINDIKIINSVYIPVTLEDVDILISHLSNVKISDDKEFVYKGYIFDFSNYNPESVNAVLDTVYSIISIIKLRDADFTSNINITPEV